MRPLQHPPLQKLGLLLVNLAMSQSVRMAIFIQVPVGLIHSFQSCKSVFFHLVVCLPSSISCLEYWAVVGIIISRVHGVYCSAGIKAVQKGEAGQQKLE